MNDKNKNGIIALVTAGLLACPCGLRAHHHDFHRACTEALAAADLSTIQDVFAVDAWEGEAGPLSGAELKARLEAGERLTDASSTGAEHALTDIEHHGDRCVIGFTLGDAVEGKKNRFWFLAEQGSGEGAGATGLQYWQIVRTVTTADEAETFLAAVSGDENPPPSELTLERIFSDKEFTAESFALKWRDKGQGYTFVSEEHPGEIWQSSPGHERSAVMVTSAELTPYGSASPLKIEDYAFSEDEAFCLIFTNSQRVWRQNTRGDYWLLDRGSGELRQLGGDAPPSSLMFAKISPSCDRVAYVRERNLYIEEIQDGAIRQLTTTPSEAIINGTADWVYEEELGVRDGFRWSPDGRMIAYWQFDETGVPHQTLIDHVSGLYPKITSFAYPKTGQQNAACRIGVVSADGGAPTQWMQLPGDPRQHYLARMEWSADSDALVIQQLNRAQTHNRVFRASADDGSVNLLLEEIDEAWVEIHDECFWLKGKDSFLWVSERSGWRQLYLVAGNGTEMTRLTDGTFDVIRFLQTDETERWAYFIASPGNPAQRFLYRVALDGSELHRVTPLDHERGTHHYNISPDGRHAAWTVSTLETPPVTSLVSLPEHQTLRVLQDNEALREKVDALDRGSAEFFYVDIGNDVRLHTRCLTPPGFDPQGSYPLLIHVYGEPAGQVVTDHWGGGTHLWHLMLAQQGYVIMSFDNEGTAAPRGRAWRRAAHRRIGVLAPEQQAAAVEVVLKERPYLDRSRVGSWGWSGGGSMSLNAIFKYPKLYQTAIAVASVPNQRYYDTIYQERYMGLPTENVEGYRQGSPLHFAHQLEGNLLIVHGAQDDNCHYQTFEKLVDVLVQHNKTFSMMTYPRGAHGVREGKNTTLHLYGLMTRFLHENLPLSAQ